MNSLQDSQVQISMEPLKNSPAIISHQFSQVSKRRRLRTLVLSWWPRQLHTHTHTPQIWPREAALNLSTNLHLPMMRLESSEPQLVILPNWWIWGWITMVVIRKTNPKKNISKNSIYIYIYTQFLTSNDEKSISFTVNLLKPSLKIQEWYRIIELSYTTHSFQHVFPWWNIGVSITPPGLSVNPTTPLQPLNFSIQPLLGQP